jgi:hypothetical protein
LYYPLALLISPCPVSNGFKIFGGRGLIQQLNRPLQPGGTEMVSRCVATRDFSDNAADASGPDEDCEHLSGDGPRGMHGVDLVQRRSGDPMTGDC